jgi:hypothetical protein
MLINTPPAEQRSSGKNTRSNILIHNLRELESAICGVGAFVWWEAILVNTLLHSLLIKSFQTNIFRNEFA